MRLLFRLEESTAYADAQSESYRRAGPVYPQPHPDERYENASEVVHAALRSLEMDEEEHKEKRVSLISLGRHPFPKLFSAC